MLNETFALNRALDRAGIALPPNHPHIKTPASSSGPVIKICLNVKGAIVRCEGVVKENHDRLWTYLPGGTSGGSFPVIRIAEPLWMVPEKHEESRRAKLSPSEHRATLREALKSASPRPFSKKTLGMLVRLRDRAQKLANVLEGVEEDISIVRQLCDAYARVVPESSKGIPPLLTNLRNYARQWLEDCDDMELDALDVLLFTASSNSNKKKAQLALDVDDIDSTIYHAGAKERVTRLFLGHDARHTPSTVKSVSRSEPVCAYGGAIALQAEPFPKVKVPVLGEVPLFSMNADAECNQRYHRAGHELLPVSRQLVLDMQDSLEEIVRELREGKTWRRIASEKPNGSDLLIVYVDGQPDISADVADLFGADTDTKGKQFSVVASTVCQALDGVRQQTPDCRLGLFILRKASKGQAFVALSETPSIEEVIEGTEWWQEAAANIPLGAPMDAHVISLPISDKPKERKWLRPSAPSPGQVTALLIEAQKKRSKKQRGAAFGEVLDLMLQRHNKAQAAAGHILSLCLQHAGHLLCGLGECQGRGKGDRWKAYISEDRRIALRTVSAIGIALYTLGSRKEAYMNEAAFQVGRVLALADRLHRCYCVVVRESSMPRHLIGNAAFNAALDSPEKALAILAERIRIYQGWGETVKWRSGEDEESKAIRIAKKTLSRYKPLVEKLHQQGIPNSCTDLMRAHLMLGYLAKEEDEEKPKGEDK